jgi:hypothetical protein
MADVFVSYAREDQARVAPLVELLERQGWSVFWDRDIPPGETWRSHIGAALERARCVVVAWTGYSILSDWVAEEADEARARDVLVPVLLDPVIPPRGLRGVQAADLTGWPHQVDPHMNGAFLAAVAKLVASGPPAAEIGRSDFPEPVDIRTPAGRAGGSELVPAASTPRLWRKWWLAFAAIGSAAMIGVIVMQTWPNPTLKSEPATGNAGKPALPVEQPTPERPQTRNSDARADSATVPSLSNTQVPDSRYTKILDIEGQVIEVKGRVVQSTGSAVGAAGGN